MDGLDASFKSDDYSPHLVANIANQKGAVYDPELFCDYIDPHVQAYYQEHHRSDNFFRSNDPSYKSNIFPTRKEKLNYVTYDLGEIGPWVNFQRKNEHQPLHRHSGDLSLIIFIKIPKEIKEERLYNRENGLPNSSTGLVDFWCNDRNWFLSPESKQILLFPSTLLHCVYPFTSDVERVTMSFNLHNVDKHYE